MSTASPRMATVIPISEDESDSAQLVRSFDDNDAIDAGLVKMDTTKAIVITCVLVYVTEIIILVVGFGVFGPDSKPVICNFILFGTMTCCRIGVICKLAKFLRRDDSNSSWPDERKMLNRWLSMFNLAPFAFYLPNLMHEYVHDCDYHLKIMNQTAYFSEWDGRFRFFSIECSGNLPSSSFFAVQAASQILVPVIFGFIFVRLGSIVWGMDLLDDKTRAHLQISMLDLFDVATFITMPMYASTFVFLKGVYMWRRVLEVLYVQAFITVLFEVVLISPFTCLRIRTARAMLLENALSLVLIDLPFFLVRCYFAFYVNAAVTYMLLLKNLVCIIHQVANMSTCGEANPCTSLTLQLVNLMPGEATVRCETARQVFQRTRSNLTAQEGQILDLKETIAAVNESLALMERQSSALSRIYSHMREGKERLEDLEVAFRYFDFDGSNILEDGELQKIYQMMPFVPPGLAANDIKKELGTDGGIVDVQHFTLVFWRKCQEKYENSSDEDDENS